MTYNEYTDLWLTGKTIRKSYVKGDRMVLKFEDGTAIDYSASDGVYSDWSLITADGNYIDFKDEEAK